MLESFLHIIYSPDNVMTGKQMQDVPNYTGDRFSRDIAKTRDLLTNREGVGKK